MTTKLSDPVSELGVLLSGESLERLAIFRRETLSEDPGADMGPGQLARVGQAFKDIGGECEAVAKSLVRPQIEGGVGSSAKTQDAGVMFSWRRGSRRVSVDADKVVALLPYGGNPEVYSVAVDTAKVKALFPEKEYPELYKVSETRDSVSASIADLT